MATDGIVISLPQLQIMQLQASNLAIGKSNASYALDVQGDINIDGNILQNGNSIFNDAVAVGTIMSWASSYIPQYYLMCNGAAISRSAYSALFSAIGTTYGAGDGTITFNLPDLRGRVMVGTGSTTYTDTGVGATRSSASYVLGNKGGEEKHTLTTNEIPSHSHTTTTGGEHRHSIGGDGGGYNYGQVFTTDTWRTGTGAWTNYEGTHSHTINVTGGSNAQTLMQPYSVLQYIIKALPQYNSSEASNNYWVQTGNSTYLSSSNTNIGIGITAPMGPLHIGSMNAPNALFVGSNGCVGIGTSNPTSSLTVIGNINLTGSLNGNISLSNLSFSNINASNITTNGIVNRYNISVIGHEPVYLQEIASSNHWEGVTPITSATINNFGVRGGTVRNNTAHNATTWNNYYMIEFTSLTSISTLPASTAKYFYTPITIDPTTHNQIFMSVITCDRWSSINAFVLNSNLDPVYPLGVQTNTIATAGITGCTARLGPNNIQAIANRYREWISWMLPNHIIAANLVSGTSNVVRIGFCGGPNTSGVWVSGIKCCPNPYANTYQSSVDLHWGSVSSMWGNSGFPGFNGNWNEDNLAHIDPNVSRIINILLPQVSSTNSDLLIGFVVHNDTWYSWEGRITLPYMGSLISIIPNPIQIGRYGYGMTGRGIYRRAYGFILPYEIWSNDANILTYQGAQALRITLTNLFGHNAVHMRALYSEFIQPFYTA